jgi:hypothetical protein
MKSYLLITAGLLAFAAFFLVCSANELSAIATPLEYATIRWDGRDNTCVILPTGKVDIVGAQLKALARPEHVDERAFYMNVVMNSLGREGFDFAGISNDENVIIMKRPFHPPAR